MKKLLILSYSMTSIYLFLAFADWESRRCDIGAGVDWPRGIFFLLQSELEKMMREFF